MNEIKIKKNQINKNEKRYPTLSTVMMVEDFLKENSDMPMKISQLRRNLPKQVMHQTLKVILEYLFRSGKVIYGPKGVQWIYAEPDYIKKMLNGGMEL